MTKRKTAPRKAAVGTTQDIPINAAQVSLFRQIEAGLADLEGKRDAGLLVLLAGAGFKAGKFALQGFDFEAGIVRVQLPAAEIGTEPSEDVGR